MRAAASLLWAMVSFPAGFAQPEPKPATPPRPAAVPKAKIPQPKPVPPPAPVVPPVEPLREKDKPVSLLFFGPANQIGFKNNDPSLVQKFHWRLRGGSLDCASPPDGAAIAPKATLYVDCAWMRGSVDMLTAGSLKPEARPVRIRVASSAADLDAAACAACTEFDGVVTLNYFPPYIQAVVNGLLLLGLLFAGGLLSHVIGISLPNLSRKLRLKSRLETVRTAIAWAGVDLDDEFPARFAAQRARLREIVVAQRSWDNDTADVLRHVETELSGLETRVTIAARLVALRRRLCGLSRTAFRREKLDAELRMLVPDLVDESAGDAAVGLIRRKLVDIQRAFPGTVDLQFEKFCADQQAAMQEVAEELRRRPSPQARRLAAQFDAMRESKLQPVAYDDYERVLRTMALADRVLTLAKSGKTDPRQADELIGAIANTDGGALDGVAGRILQLEEGVTVELLLDSLRRRGPASIDISPGEPRPRESAIVKIEIDDRFQELVRQRLVRFLWSFEFDNRTRFTAGSAAVPCYFTHHGPWTIRLKIAAKANTAELELKKTVNVRSANQPYIGDKAKVEMARIGATQLMAAVAAVATVWDQIASANLVFAVFAAIAAGYAADTVKSIGGKLTDKLTEKLTPAEDPKTAKASLEQAQKALEEQAKPGG